MYDIVFISYNEPNADDNWLSLKSRFPMAKRVNGISGIHQAHIFAAKQCFTDMFWVVDGDAVILDSFNFEYIVPKKQLNTVHVWRSKNPVNDLEYGYGGVKLLPRNLTITMDITKPDMTTGISQHFKAIPEISNITAFNTDPFSTWRSAFRECVKLSSKIIERQKTDETNSRLDIWCTIGEDRPFGKFAVYGAICGREYGLRYHNERDQIQKINNFDYLKEIYNTKVKEKWK